MRMVLNEMFRGAFLRATRLMLLAAAIGILCYPILAPRYGPEPEQWPEWVIWVIVLAVLATHRTCEAWMKRRRQRR